MTDSSSPNTTRTLKLPTPQTADEFSFPMTPYAIQLDFMKRLFETIEESKFAIFESPTGTGKSLSIICGALTWLSHHKERRKLDIPEPTPGGGDCPDWVAEFERKQRIERSNAEMADGDLAQTRYKAWVASTRRKEAAERRGRMVGRTRGSGEDPAIERKRRATADIGANMSSEGGGDSEVDDDMIVDAYYSDTGEGSDVLRAHASDAEDGSVRYSAEVRKLLAKRAANKPYYDSDSENDSENNALQLEPPVEPSVTKIFYASRTHSQLQQFISEIKRTSFGKSSKIKCVTLGSRWQLCTNDRVRSDCHSVHSLNERCLEMQQQGSKKTRCAFLPAQRTPMFDYKESIGSKIMDIEELATEGRRLSVCAYYGTRAAVSAAQVVALPYNMLLSQSARESMGVSLKDNVVIIDEAHNLVDTILSIHSVTLDRQTVGALTEMLQMYFTKYWRRLKGSNTIYVRQTLALLKALRKFMDASATEALGKESTGVLSVNEFLQRANADHINVYKIDRYLRESKIGRKLNMFGDHCRQQTHMEDGASGRGAKRGAGNNAPVASVGPAPATAVAAFESFMGCIGNPDRKGARLVVRASAAGGSEKDAVVELKYLLLDPSEAFGSICSEARAIILAGGTMKPANDVVEQLLPLQASHLTDQFAGKVGNAVAVAKLDSKNAQLFAWNHVVDSSHVCAVVVSSGPTGQPLRFAFQDQSDPAKIREAGQALASMCNIIPGGIVVFFPSYSLLGRMLAEWRSAGIVQRIERRKPLFAESNAPGGDGEPQVNILEKYTEQVHRPGSNGAVLLSVVSGRLSEGINFSDNLGRAVIMVGVPFPSLASPELAERLAYYEFLGSNSKPAEPLKDSSMGPRARELYESLCMRAVNQSIGRAIRHRHDYAAIVFLDARYADARIASKLPSWILPPPVVGHGVGAASVPKLAFGPALSQIAAFFKRDFKSV
ncbi:ATP-dependent DNA helicase chl1 [Kickxella alabastrina]|uniref:ATP-dependent DNA helicase chl1 n=1 Tax=Kickxella alabastrina TaxID=61397 RepID=A0ACC1IT95_9FUNG|nr:ATP-dependent DNA helicase chl1 [Kickxella alabastrina]